MGHGAWSMERGFGCWELEARGSGSDFGGPPKPTGWRPVLPIGGRPSGAAGYQPRASAAPPWVSKPPHFISKHHPKHQPHPAQTEGGLRPSIPGPKRRQSRRTLRAGAKGPGACISAERVECASSLALWSLPSHTTQPIASFALFACVNLVNSSTGRVHPSIGPDSFGRKAWG